MTIKESIESVVNAETEHFKLELIDVVLDCLDVIEKQPEHKTLERIITLELAINKMIDGVKTIDRELLEYANPFLAHAIHATIGIGQEALEGKK
jgi:hypothetical protein